MHAGVGGIGESGGLGVYFVAKAAQERLVIIICQGDDAVDMFFEFAELAI